MAKFCPECGNAITDTSLPLCSKCGAQLPQDKLKQHSPAQQQTNENSTKKRSTGKWIAICCGGIIVIVVLAAFITGITTNLSQNSVNSHKLSIVEIKNQANSIPWTDLMRTPDNYKNTIVYFRGKVLQIQNEYGNKYMLRIATKKTPYLGYLEDAIYVDYEGIPEYNGNRILENDIVDLWGNFVGIKTYNAILGNEVTVPEINALDIELISDTSETDSTDNEIPSASSSSSFLITSSSPAVTSKNPDTDISISDTIPTEPLTKTVTMHGSGDNVERFSTVAPGKIVFNINYNSAYQSSTTCSEKVFSVRLNGKTIDTIIFKGNSWSSYDETIPFQIVEPQDINVEITGCNNYYITISNE
jgi:hypothetical protein